MKQLLQTLFFFLLVTQICFAQWVQTSLDSLVINCLVVKDTAVFAGTSCSDGGIYRSSDNGASWTVVNLGLPTNDYVNCFDVSGNNLFAGLEWAGVFLSTNNGITWTQINAGLTNKSIADLLVSGTNLFAATASGGIFLSTNNGTTWTSIQDSLITGGSVYCLTATVDEMGDTVLWAVAYRRGGGVCRSTDGGTSWAATSLNNPYVRSIESIGNRVFAGAIGDGWIGEGVFLTTNNGTSWNAIDTGLTNKEVWTLAVSHTNLFAGTAGGGVFLSTNNGSNWTAVNTGLTSSLIRSFAVSGTNLFAGTWYGGVWRRPLSEMVVPVELTTFSASVNGKEVMLSWSTATELNNYGFEIQRKVLSGDFATVAFVKGQGTTTQQNQYSFADKNLDEGKYFYRLKQIDYGGKYEYSQTVEVDVRLLSKYSLEQNYPNPFNPVTTIGYVLQEKSNAKLTMLNSLGEEIAVLVNEEQDKGYHKVEFDALKLTSGVYFYQLQAGEFTQTRKMILIK